MYLAGIHLFLVISFAVIFVVQSLSHVRLFVTPRTAACQDSLSCTISWSLLKLMSIETMMPSNHLILCRPLLLLPQGLFQLVGSSHQVTKVLPNFILT